VVASGRLDNISELADKVELPKKSENKTECLEEIIALAYLKWGRSCPSHLLGDFVFAIWDKNEKRLFCARDHLGMKPFYYFCNNNRFSFSSSLDILLMFQNIPKKVNEERLVDYMLSVCLDNESTFYKHIFRLPPAHSITVSENNFEIDKYWEYSYSPLSYKKNSDYEEAFREIFRDAVECRMHSKDLAITLSGGLDSTSVACVAEKKIAKENDFPLQVYSGIFNKYIQCDEQEYIKETLRQGSFRWNKMVVDETNPLESLFEIASVQKQPWYAPHHFMYWNLLSRMESNHVQLLLDGHDGDTVISNDLWYFIELIEEKKLLSLLKETVLAHKALSRSIQKKILLKYFRKNINPLIYHLFRFKGTNSSNLPPQAHSNNALLEACSQSFLKRSNAKERLEFAASEEENSPKQRFHHIKHAFHPIQPFALEVLGRSAENFSIEYRCPFWDKRLVEFCLSLPTNQKFQNGWPRSIQRRSMQGIIPKKIQWRADKTDFTPDMEPVLDLIYNKPLENSILGQCQKELSDWFDVKKLIDHHKSHPEKKDPALSDVWKVLTVYAWLKNENLSLND